MPKTNIVALTSEQSALFKHLMQIKPQIHLYANYKPAGNLPTLDFAFPDAKIAIVSAARSIDKSKFEGWLFLRF